MKINFVLALRLTIGTFALSLPLPLHAQAPRPGSVLVFPLHDSESLLTLVSVTNTNLTSGGDVRATFRYVNVTPDPQSALNPLHCNATYRGELLTPGDTVTTLTACHNAGRDRGYLVVSAASPSAGFATSHNHLVGSSLVISPLGSVYSVPPYSFEALAAEGSATDADIDGRLDFDGIEYRELPRYLFADSIFGIANTRLVLLHLDSSLNDDVTVKLDIMNDNEFPLSYTFTFRCWFEIPLAELSPMFTQNFLASTPHDPDEIDINCDGVGDLESAWFRIDPISSSNGFQTSTDPAVLGGLTAGAFDLEAGRILWGTGTTPNGEF